MTGMPTTLYTHQPLEVIFWMLEEQSTTCFRRQMTQVDRHDSPPPRTVDLVRLERALEEAPPGLQIPEAVKAKKTAAR